MRKPWFLALPVAHSPTAEEKFSQKTGTPPRGYVNVRKTSPPDAMSVAPPAGLEPAAKRLEDAYSVPALSPGQGRVLDGSILAIPASMRWVVVWFADGRHIDPGRDWNRAAKQANLDQLAEECVRERGNVARDRRLPKPAILWTIGGVRSPCDCMRWPDSCVYPTPHPKELSRDRSC
ncbi:hypothetical protein GCM10010433_50530 [Streptomyces pulveraceus]